MCRVSGVKKLPENITEGKLRAERMHFDPKLSDSMDPFKGGLKPYPELHGKSENEHVVEKDMGIKKAITDLPDKRNNLELKSLGDKPYKFSEESANFYKGGGLIPGSTQPEKMEKKSTGNTKIVDYYANLDLTKPVPTKGLKWKDKLKLEALAEDKKAVNDLIKWYIY